MHLDCREYPAGYTYAEVASNDLGLYVNVADFTEVNGQRIFRMIVDAELTAEQIYELLFSKVTDQHKTYEFFQIEAIMGPSVDQAPRTGPTSHYMRVTFM